MGIQVISKALGGEVILDNEHREVGTYSITLNEDGQQDPLFSKFPKTF
ncbi:MAG TPA: type 1 glutamine amidotransferase, partial [Candidatus Marinimicrobia bacterium]|nr:type 1 glutamine amidotransferase [Candidatus Neomarinimicrobiota bacterium]